MKSKLTAFALACTLSFMACGDDSPQSSNPSDADSVSSEIKDTLYIGNSGSIVIINNNLVTDTLIQKDTILVRDTLIKKDTIQVKDTLIKKDTVQVKETLIKKDTVLVRDTLIQKDTIQIRDTLVQKDTIYINLYDTVTTEFLNQEMLANGKYEELVDTRDNKLYRTIKIGKQTWIAQNMNYSENDISNRCYDSKLTNSKKYGRLYTWAVSLNSDISNTPIQHLNQGICPMGWHIPDSTDIHNLIQFIVSDKALKYPEATIASALKSASTSWTTGTGITPPQDLYGFSAAPSGFFNKYQGKYYEGGTGFHMWTTTVNSSNGKAIPFQLNSKSENFSAVVDPANDNALSVRCIKNEDY